MRLIPSPHAAPHLPRNWSVRALFLALALAFVPLLQAHAGVMISVTVAPPVLPVYEQPPCPEPDMIWSPGYWAYDYDAGGYYWVPGAWVPAPYQGALWTPPYWGWENGVYMFHTGYWGPEVGYYGGVNYGFGYMGIGFVGGRWDNDHFAYNTAVMRVNQTVIHNTYINNTIVQQNTVINNNHVAYSGGPGGVRHDPTPEERHAMQVPHQPPTQYQQQHIQSARTDRSNFYNANHGHPQQVAIARPLPAAHYQPPAGVRAGAQGNVNGRPGNEKGNAGVNARPGAVTGNAGARGENRPMPNEKPNNRTAGQQEARPESRSTPQPRHTAPESRPAPQPQPRPESHQAPVTRPAPQARPESRPVPESHPEPQPQHTAPRPAPQPEPRPESHSAPVTHPAPQARPEPRPVPESRPALQPQHTAPRPAPQPQPRPESHSAPVTHPAPQARPEPHTAPPPHPQSHPAPRPENKPREPQH